MKLSDLSAKLDELIVNDQLHDALKLLKNFSKSSSELNIKTSVKDSIIDLIHNTQGRLNGLERNRNMGVLKEEDYRTEMNAIRQTILTIQNAIDEVAQGKTPNIFGQSPTTNITPSTSMPETVAHTDNFLKYIILGFAGLCGVAFFVFLFLDDMLQGAALSFTGVAGSIYGYMRFRIMETTLQFVNTASTEMDAAAISAALSKNILNIRK